MRYLLLILLLVFGCEHTSGTSAVYKHGCVNSQACNYNPEANIDNNSCWYVTEGCNCEDLEGAVIDECGECDSDEANNCVQDCNGEWGGDGVDADNDGICDDVDECVDADLDGVCADEDLDECVDADEDDICDDVNECVDADEDDICDDVDECIGEYDKCDVCNGENHSWWCSTDLNSTSSTYSNQIGAHTWDGEIRLFFFSANEQCELCINRFDQLNDLYLDYLSSDVDVYVIGVGQNNEIPVDQITDGNNLPWVKDDEAWSEWGASNRDLYIMDKNGEIEEKINLTIGFDETQIKFIINGL